MAQTLEQRIRRVIKGYYGDNLWIFRHDVGYRRGTKDFVTDVAKAIRGELEHSTDLPNPIAKYSKFSCTDRNLGRSVQELRALRNITQEELAELTGFSLDFVIALEKGYIIAAINLWGKAYDALKPTEQESKKILDTLFKDRTQEDVIREVVEVYYGLSLWAFNPEVGYEEAITPFIKSLAALGNMD